MNVGRCPSTTQATGRKVEQADRSIELKKSAEFTASYIIIASFFAIAVTPPLRIVT